MNTLILILGLFSFPALAEDDLSQPEYVPAYEEEAGRGPAAVPSNSSKRNFPGGVDEEDLRVQAYLPEAALKSDARSIQREVYKALYNQELKDERQDSVEE